MQPSLIGATFVLSTVLVQATTLLPGLAQPMIESRGKDIDHMFHLNIQLEAHRNISRTVERNRDNAINSCIDMLGDDSSQNNAYCRCLVDESTNTRSDRPEQQEDKSLFLNPAENPFYNSDQQATESSFGIFFSSEASRQCWARAEETSSEE
jgi:hypothetical protein